MKTRCIFREFPLYTMYSVHCASRFRSPCAVNTINEKCVPGAEQSQIFQNQKFQSLAFQELVNHCCLAEGLHPFEPNSDHGYFRGDLLLLNCLDDGLQNYIKRKFKDKYISLKNHSSSETLCYAVLLRYVFL